MRILGRSEFTELQGDKYDTCHVCGPLKYRAVVHFDSGSVAPTVGETVTGATSADTGIVEFAQLTEGSYAGGDAVGVMVLNTPTGYDQYNLSIFSDDENLNGSTAGDNFATVKGICGVSKSGRVHPDSNLVKYRGIKYCTEHFMFMFKKSWEDEATLNINEKERGK
jgi:hypothetical protein